MNLYNLAITLLAIYPRERKSYVHAKTGHKCSCTLFILAQNRNQPKCPSVGEWFSKLWYIHTMEHDSAMKNNGLLAHTMT